MSLRIGLLFEGKYDQAPIQNIVRRFLSDVDVNFLPYPPAEGPIINKIEPALRVFYDFDKCDLAIFIADTDNQKDKKKILEAKYTEVAETLLRTEPYVIACPNPNFEQWFIVEEDALKNALGIIGSDPLDFPEIIDPKEKVYQLWRKYSKNREIPFTRPNLYNEVSNNLNLDKLSSDAAFNNFQQDLRQAAKKALSDN